MLSVQQSVGFAVNVEKRRPQQDKCPVKKSLMNITPDMQTNIPLPLFYNLGHANTRAFLSHGGLNSIYEAMYHGVPVVGVPLFGDHYDTMTRVAAKGMGIMLHWKYMSEEDLYTALTSVITDSRLECTVTHKLLSIISAIW